MLRKGIDWLFKKKKEIHTKRLEKLIEKQCQKVSENTSSKFIASEEQKQLSILNKLETSQQVLKLASYQNLGDFFNLFQDKSLSDTVREKILEKMSLADCKKFLSQVPENYATFSVKKGDIFILPQPYPNFFFAPLRYQEAFLFKMSSPQERSDFLKIKIGIYETVFEHLTHCNLPLADKILMNLTSFTEAKTTIQTYNERGGYYWPQACSPVAQEYLLSLIPFEDMQSFLQHKDKAQVSLFEKMPIFIQKKIIALYDNHPHLMQRLLSEGIFKKLPWSLKTQIACQMKNKKYVLELFKTPTDETGKKPFYQTPYKEFRKFVYEKFPELDIYPKIKTSQKQKISKDMRQKGEA